MTNDLPVNGEMIDLLSPKSSFLKAAEYVLSQKKKGFSATSEQNTEPEQIYRDIIDPHVMKKTRLRVKKLQKVIVARHI